MEEEDEELQMKPISSIQRETMEEEEELQMKSLVQRRENLGGGEASPNLELSIQSARGSGQSLDTGLQEKMGQAMGADFSSVKVHTDSQSDRLNKSIQAKAFTTGQDVFFRQGEYDPSSREGQELIAHELTHVVQQNSSGINRKELKDNKTTEMLVHSAPSLSGTDILVQPKFGFEVELQVALTKKVKEQRKIKTGNIFKPVEKLMDVDIYKDPRLVWNDNPAMSTEYPTIADAGNYEIKLDHKSHVAQGLDEDKPIGSGNDTDNKGGGIIELVTKPIDENEPVQTVENIMNELVVFARGLNIGNGGRVQLNTHGITAPDSIYVGMDYKANQNNTKGDIQATHGIKLGKVNKLLTTVADKGEKKENTEDKTKAWRKADFEGRAIMTNIEGNFPSSSQDEKDELTGLITLLRLYILASCEGAGGLGWGKNKLGGLFYKSKLSDLPIKLKSYEIRLWLTNNVDTLQGLVSGTHGAESMTASMTVKDWVTEVLNGTDDKVFEANKNPYAKAITPEKVGATGKEGIGAIIENRTLTKVLPDEIIGKGSGAPISKWVEVAKEFHQMTKDINA
jgi:hypothetical protein